MSAQQASQSTTSQTTSREQQTSLARRGSRSSVPSLWMDPLDAFVNPFALFRRMQDEVSRVFGQTARAISGTGEEPTTFTWAPAVDVEYRNGKLEVSAELPGLQENDVKVEISNDVLVIQGERKIEQEESQGGIRRIERKYGQFYRAIPLPDGVEADKARAEFQNGVLHVTIPVSQANVRQIPVQTTQPAQGEKATKTEKAA
jgi:HSP20 family protein